MSRWLKYFFITVYIVVGLLMISLAVVPWQIKSQSSSWISQNTSRTLEIDRVLFNPFNMTVVLEGLDLSEQNSEKTFLSFGRLTLSITYQSLVNLALIVDQFLLTDPYINIELLGKQEFNFSDFTRIAMAEPEVEEEQEPGEETTFHFSVNNIAITGGSVDFTDRTSEKNSRHTIREFTLHIPFIGNVPYLTEDYVQPDLRFLLNDAEILAEGKTLPFHETLETSLDLSLEGVDLSYYADNSPVPLPVEVPSGRFDSELELLYRVVADEIPKFLIKGNFLISDIDIREPGGEKLFQLPELSVELEESSLFDLDIRVNSLEVRQPKLFISRDSVGVINLTKLVGETATEKDEKPKADQSVSGEKDTLPLFKARKIALDSGEVHFRDDYVEEGFQETLQGIELQIDNLSTHPDERADIAFSLQTTRQMDLSLEGAFGLQPLSGDLALSLSSFQMLPHYPYVAELLTMAPAGELGFATDIVFGPEVSLRLERMNLGLQQLSIPFTDEDGFNLAELTVKDGLFDLDKMQLNIGGIVLRSGDLSARRYEDGSFSPLALLRKDSTEEELSTQQGVEPVQLELPWRENSVAVDKDKFEVVLDALNVDDFALEFRDESLPKQPQVNISSLNVGVENLSYPESRQSPFNIEFSVAPQGQMSSSGTVAHSPLRVEAKTVVEAFSLPMLNDFLPEDVQTSLEDGNLYLDIAMTAGQEQNEFNANFSGGVSVENFNLRDPLSDGELLSWNSLNVKGISGAITPLQLNVQEVSLDGYQAKILVNSNGEVNLASVTAKKAADEQVSTDDGATNKEDKEQGTSIEQAENIATASSSSPDISVETITLQGGTVSFTDRNLPNTFNTTMYKLGGRISGVSSKKEMQADVDLRGELENHSPLTITGKIDPLRDNFYTDLSIKFKNIDLVPMSPYSGTYLGYAIDKGKLYLDLSYRIEDNYVTAENRVMIDQFTFGETVKSEKATSLPVSLAVALLKDRSGEIHLDVPVSGDLTDPSFSVIGTVFGVLKNLMVKAATAPFALLGSMLGGGEEFSSVTFAPGSAEISDEQQQKLVELADMLVKRPALILELSGFVDREGEPEAYRQLQLQQKLRRQKFNEMRDAGEEVPNITEITISDKEYPKYLTMVYENADFPRPRNALGMLKKLPPEEMEKLILANIRAGDEEMKRLATARVHAVRDFLYAANEEIKQQIFLKNVDVFDPPGDGVPSRVEFGISAK